MNPDIQIVPAASEHLDQVLAVEKAAFSTHEEAELTEALLNDASAQPCLSLLAFHNQRAIGHILFTHARLERYDQYKVTILAPLAVVPAYQKQGVGARLITAGLEILRTRGLDLVFVLGHMDYYPRFGFIPAHPFAIAAPHPRPAKYRDAWMVYPIGQGIEGQLNTTVRCCEAFDRPEHWC